MPELVERDYVILCLACGCIAPEPEWSYWQHDFESDADDAWRPARPGEGDPMMRCPSCGWEHIDDDGNPGIYDGTNLEVRRYRQEIADDRVDDWVARMLEVKIQSG